ncbi:ABC transporter permease subunit [Allorhodopirellula solitaria]|uniref:ABC-2 family transporter protein n=1 Tax=Allorhodopirellula solitaria TaxID=2527987 RepID=A0A5C5YJT2_9BACT|nr:ABC transporter permease subunit [Allorhodopirellula solitaria]TWT75108.1 ABC-2 family transporter protein [Allorhodopirellula solitaria]
MIPLRDVGVDRMMIRKNIGQSSLLFLFLGIAMFSFGWVRVWVVKLLEMGKFQNVIEQFRDYERFAPVPFDALFTYAGRVGMTFDEPIVILCTVIWCVARGSDVISGELGRGTLEMLLSQPISRTRFLMSHAFVSAAGLLGLCLLLWAGMTVGIETTTVTETIAPPSIRVPLLGLELPLSSDPPAEVSFSLGERVAPGIYTASVFHLFAFGYFLLGLSSCISSFDRYRWRTIGAVMTVYVVQLVMFGLGKAAESLAWLQSLTFFRCYQPQKMTTLVREGGLSSPWSFSQPIEPGWYPPLYYPLLLLALGTACYLIAVVRFERRDLPAPL